VRLVLASLLGVQVDNIVLTMEDEGQAVAFSYAIEMSQSNVEAALASLADEALVQALFINVGCGIIAVEVTHTATAHDADVPESTGGTSRSSKTAVFVASAMGCVVGLGVVAGAFYDGTRS